MDLGGRIVNRLGQMVTARSRHESVWRDAFDFSFPARSDGFYGEQMDASTIQDRYARLADSTAADAARTLVASIQGGMTPANTQWAANSVPDATDEEKSWLDEAATTQWKLIHASNFDSESVEAMTDILAGWFVLFIDEDRERGGYHFTWWPMSQCYLAQSRAGGLVDILYRKYSLRAEQAVNAFDQPGDNLSRKVIETAEKEPDAPVEFVHAIYPRKGKPAGLMARNLPFASVHVECSSKHVVRESGFHEQPFAAPRWNIIPNTSYGIGPMSVVLPDVRTLNELKRMQLAAADLAVSGMWIAEDDGVLNPRTVKVGPRKIIVANSVDSMKPLLSGSQFDVAFTNEERLQSAIRKGLMADALPPVDAPTKTATEYHVRLAMLRQLLGPLFGRLQAEYLKVLWERSFGLAFRAGAFPPPPKSLQGKIATVQYLSPLARAQKLEEVTAIERLFVSAAQASQIALDAMDNIDTDEAIRITGDGLGVPNKVMRDKEAVAAMREERAKAQAKAQQQEVMAPVVQEAGKAMAQTFTPA